MKHRNLPRVGTLADVLLDDQVLRLICMRRGCLRNVDMNIGELIGRYGGNHPMQRFLERCVCSKCGARYPDVSLQAVPRITTMPIDDRPFGHLNPAQD